MGCADSSVDTKVKPAPESGAEPKKDNPQVK